MIAYPYFAKRQPPPQPPDCEVGDRIELLHMDNDPDPILAGSKGKVTHVNRLWDDTWQIAVDWENGRTLTLVHPEDRFKVIERRAKLVP
jgi:hypothetical protein